MVAPDIVSWPDTLMGVLSWLYPRDTPNELLRARATLGYREKKMPPGKVYENYVKSYVYTYYYSIYNDCQILIEVAQQE